MLVKPAGNHMIPAMGELLGESLALLRAGGAGGTEAREALLDDLMPRIFAGYARRMAERPDAPRVASSPVGRKDNGLILEAAAKMGSDLPLARFLNAGRPTADAPRRSGVRSGLAF